jgi:hypothetical protein
MSTIDDDRDAFYLRSAPDIVVPTKATVGPWDPKLQHGGPPAALLGDAIERASSSDASMRVASFSMDFLGPVPLEPMTIATEVVRGGKKIELVTATASIGGRAALRVNAWRIAVEDGRTPEKNVEPAPPLPPPVETPLFRGVPRFGYGESLEWRFVEGAFTELGPATVWSRLRVVVVRGELVTPLARALSMVDSANGISLELEVTKFLAVPVNLTVSLSRWPEGEWVGMNARTRIAREGVGTTHARLFDRRGTIGEAMQTLFVAPR